MESYITSQVTYVTMVPRMGNETLRPLGVAMGNALNVTRVWRYICKNTNYWPATAHDVTTGATIIKELPGEYIIRFFDRSLRPKHGRKPRGRSVSFPTRGTMVTYVTWDVTYFITHTHVHITYCLTTWSHACITTLKPLESLYKQSQKTLDKKSVQFHHCSILKKYNLLSWDNLIKYVHICLLFKTMNSLFSPLKQFVNIRTTAHRSTRGGERGDCIIPSVSLYFQSKLQGNGTPSHQQLDDYILLALFSLILKNGYWQLNTVNISIVFLTIDFLVLIALGYVALSCCHLSLFSLSFSHVYFVLDNSLIFCSLIAIFLIVCEFFFFFFLSSLSPYDVYMCDAMSLF